MDKATIKKFSQFARSRLIPDMKVLIQGWQKSEKVQGGVRIANTIYDDTELLNYTKSVDSLLKKVSKEGIDNVAEQAAYIWFNRIVALRYMEIHRYLPTRSSIFSASDGSGMPDIINNIHTEYDRIGLDANIVRKLQNEHNTEGLYELIFVGLCNKLSENYGFLFTKIDDWTQILFPRNILQTGHIIRDKNNGMLNIVDEDWNEVEIIGWIYQYYISERKDELITASKSKNQKFGKKEIGAVTQLFTPNWIVKYMVHNTVGKTWIENFPKEELKKKWEYFIDANYGDHIELNSPLDLTALDPACGSGHILVEAFNVLFDIYLSCGYLEEQIPELIIKHNLYGFEIDERAHQLACFAVLMKAKKYDKDIEKKINIGDHIICIEENNNFMDIDEKKYPQFRAFMKLWYNAKIYGSLIKFDDVELDIDKVKEEYEEFDKENGLFSLRRDELKKLIHQYELMSDSYVCVVANPPYMGTGNMDDTLRTFITKEYTDYKADLFSAFIIRNLKYSRHDGYLGFMTPYVWMFIKSYQELRTLIIDNYNISSLIQLEYSGFDGATVPICTFTLKKGKGNEGEYIGLSNFRGSEAQAPKTLEAIKNPNCGYRYKRDQNNFKKIEGSPITYYFDDKIYNIFTKGEKLGDIADPKPGLQTGENDLFLRLRYEINHEDLCLDCPSHEIAEKNQKKRFPYNKGGDYRKRYGNTERVVDRYKDGENIKADKLYKLSIGKCLPSNSKPKNMQYYFKSSLSWSKISAGRIAFRYYPTGFIFDIAGCSIFFDSEYSQKYYFGFLNGNTASFILNILAPTLNYEAGQLAKLPMIFDESCAETVINYVDKNILLAKEDWDSFETSRDFKQHPFIKYKSFKKIQSSYANWINECSERFQGVKDNEEKLNIIFNKIYGLDGIIDPSVEDKYVSIEIAFRDRDIRSLLSYMVGCMLGRYSLDQEGLIYAGGKFDSSKYISFPADDDGIIPVLQDDYFNDDVVERAKEFVRKVWGSENYTENWNYLAECLDENSNNSDQTIRTYFNKEFIDNHFQVYQKRPIYWLFTSNSKKWKESAFKVIVYMHRYDKDTITNIRHKYLHGFQAKLKEEYERLSKSNEKKDIKRCSEIQKIQIELADYDNKLKDFAEKHPGGIDLDEGVKTNYQRFLDAEIVAKL